MLFFESVSLGLFPCATTHSVQNCPLKKSENFGLTTVVGYFDGFKSLSISERSFSSHSRFVLNRPAPHLRTLLPFSFIRFRHRQYPVRLSLFDAIRYFFSR